MISALVITIAAISLATLAYGFYEDHKNERAAQEKAKEDAATPAPVKPAPVGWPPLETDAGAFDTQVR